MITEAEKRALVSRVRSANPAAPAPQQERPERPAAQQSDDAPRPASAAAPKAQGTLFEDAPQPAEEPRPASPAARQNAPVGREASAQAPVGERPSPAATTILERYRPLQTIGKGAFGSVELCLDPRLRRRVAVKRIPLRSDSDLETAQAEARAAGYLENPHIVTLHDFKCDDAYAYIVMEYVDGMSLASFLAEVDGNSLTYDELAAVAEGIGSALAYAHENQTFHLDIKPANILIDRKGHVKITDFGMARLGGASGAAANGGTIGYMPPEQMTTGHVDQRCDLFAFAAVLYEALCAYAPFRAETPEESIRLIEKGPKPPSEFLPDIPQNAERALMQALDPDPDKRQESVAVFTDALLEGLGNPREGKKSLARIIARLTDDERPEEEAEPGDEPLAWRFTPEEGLVGGRVPAARRVATGIAAGISCAWLVSELLPAFGIGGLAGIAVALSVGAAAGLAPQLGSAVAFTGFVLALIGEPHLVLALPCAVLLFVATATWWLVWGRTCGAASAVLLAGSAFAAATGQGALAAGACAMAAAYALDAGCAAATTAFALLFARFFAHATAAQFSLSLTEALYTYADLGFWFVAAGCTGMAAFGAAAFARARERWEDRGGMGLYALVIVVFGFVVVLLAALANPMENIPLSPTALAAAVGCGGLSSIIGGILLYLFGLPRSGTESERS